MSRKSKEEIVAYFKSEKGLNKLYIVKQGLETGTIKTLAQIFAIVAKSNIQNLLGGEFYAFDKKIEDPGRFSYNETEVLAAFFDVKYEVMHGFIRQNMVKAKSKRKPRS
ncbi:hypothetical protein [Filimonas effusa]|uniref:Uncharacterized protein n=1 Tax=Filimonas effusa TaxID=2508721 RepID=A0A4Q1DBZ9_9BACT|nr:hypothetical protein [Filimonas effusa]RXK87001.1 hypothetical protein ESB13_09525 [Filimonas effusa]